jgi:hypothetical protein
MLQRFLTIEEKRDLVAKFLELAAKIGFPDFRVLEPNEARNDPTIDQSDLEEVLSESLAFYLPENKLCVVNLEEIPESRQFAFLRYALLHELAHYATDIYLDRNIERVKSDLKAVWIKYGISPEQYPQFHDEGLMSSLYSAESSIWEGMAIALAYNWQIGEGLLMMQEGMRKQEQNFLQEILDKSPLVTRLFFSGLIREYGSAMHQDMCDILLGRTYQEIYDETRQKYEEAMANLPPISLNVSEEE